MRERQWSWLLVVSTAVFFMVACLNINQQTNYTNIVQEPTADSIDTQQSAAIRPSPTPVAPFPGIVYETAAGLWRVESYNETARLTTAPTITRPTTRQLRAFGVADEPLQQAALSPTGDWLAMTRPEADGQTTVWVVGSDSKEWIFLGNGMNAVWSPDGRYLIYNTNGRPQLLLADQDFYQIHLDLPPGSQVIAWLPLNE